MFSLWRSLSGQVRNSARLFLRTYVPGMALPRPVVICGPSGSGKSTLYNKLLKEFPGVFQLSVSHTTRQPRPGELNGREYHFINRDQFQENIKQGDFLEWAEFSGNIYGTSKKALEEVQSNNMIPILDIDTQGVRNVKKASLEAVYIFIKPPNIDVLEKRLRSRKTETEEALQKRLSAAMSELEYGLKPGNFQHIITNDDLDVAYEKLKGILIKSQMPMATGSSPSVVNSFLDKPVATKVNTNSQD
ncbi:GUK1 [Branchiostoma lanceolatum]|uniref:guanylate kinase n=2 Tax=Branchiostoma lanceolatum TaxID=7740 RepID=A0A8J9Z8M0_BRALA|nr:GUK1 [Branchiostoma lanceolatum]